MTQEIYQFTTKLLNEHDVALVATIQYMEFLLFQDPKYRLEEIEDEEEYRKQIRQLKIEHSKCIEATNSFVQLFRQNTQPRGQDE